MRLIPDLPYRSTTGAAFPERWTADIRLPDTAAGDCLIWIHGGGLTGGDKGDWAIAPPLVAAKLTS